MSTGKLSADKLKALFDAHLARHDKRHKDHEAKLKKMFETHAKARQEMHDRHQKARAALHAEHLKGMRPKNVLHDNERSDGM
jgi:hypothetical protein